MARIGVSFCNSSNSTGWYWAQDAPFAEHSLNNTDQSCTIVSRVWHYNPGDRKFLSSHSSLPRCSGAFGGHGAALLELSGLLNRQEPSTGRHYIRCAANPFVELRRRVLEAAKEKFGVVAAEFEGFKKKIFRERIRYDIDGNRVEVV